MRPFSDDDFKALKGATVASFEALGGVSSAARCLGVASSTLTKYASLASEWAQSFIRLDLAAQADRLTSHPYFAATLQRLVADGAPGGFGAMTASAILRLDRALDDVVRAIADAIEDDHIDSAESLLIRRKIVVAYEFLARAERMTGGGGR